MFRGATGVTGTLPTLLSNVALPIGSAITVTLTPTLGSGAVTSASITNTVVVSLPLLTGPVSATATFVVAVTRDKFNYLPVTRRD